ncbi:hypothetical protein FIV00_21510 [Labrenzia sp. THAF82]|uniref:hypothetical protein n=1 Tax=Labrenzia sp. THAF82 TaxID=2587861 RepID=UPI001267BBEA|nr:hypothetical protein [Labrenzia sp. THAF82]QFT33084.1 hypothetical protein FIV00_21510 [Labrenzia sp. THAF82]
MAENAHELAPHHLPYFIPAADGSDQMMTSVLIGLIVIVVLLGTFYLYLHSLPERLAHKHGRIQFELVAVLGLLALFTHNQIFWVAALVLAFVQLPDFMSPLESIANSMSKLANRSGDDAYEPAQANEGSPEGAAASEVPPSQPAEDPGSVAATQAVGEAPVVQAEKREDT